MGKISLPELHHATDELGDPVPHALMYVYRAGTDNLAPLFSDFHLTVTQPNPVRANDFGIFPPIHAVDGYYRAVVLAPFGEELHCAEDFPVATAVETSGAISVAGRKWFASVEAMLADSQMTYETGAGDDTVSAGEVISAIDRGYSYRIVDASATEYHLLTAGGIRLEVLRTPEGDFHTAMWGVKPGIDETAKLHNALATAAGGVLVINKVLGEVVGDTLTPAAATRLRLENGLIYKVLSGATRGIQILDQDIHVEGYGATIQMDGSQSSHGIAVLASSTSTPRNCTVSGVRVIGAGNTGDDCFYIGGDPATNSIPQNIALVDCIADGDAVARNGLSIVAGRDILVDNFEAFDAGPAFGLGIDVEANRYMADATSALRNILIRRPRCHDNPHNSGIGVVFGSEVTIEDAACWNNGGSGIITSAGGTNFKEGIARVGDVLGIKSFDTANGWIEVTDGTAGNLLTDDLDIYEGMYVSRITVNGATWPAEMSAGYYQIVEIDPSQSKIRVGVASGVGEIAGFAAIGTGERSFDPWASDLRLNVYGRPGNNDKIRIERARCWDNAEDGIQLQTSRDLVCTGCDIATQRFGLKVTYSSNVSATENVMVHTDPAAFGRGMLVTASNFVSDRNVIRNFTYEGVFMTGVSGAVCGRDQVTNCGASSNIAYRVYSCNTGTFSPVIRSDATHATTKGVALEASCSNCVGSGIIARGVGSTNANSFIGGSNTVWRDCIQKDGTFR
ncbi:right-handed parallel beta-helix repeat-containing protein [Maritimibacter dapengensis]|uniref:Right-handed parallel beta-helix repeat-containing protein n=1 Tax=Maritimibacter dapengensis TaxID=2836868 RepID=A0ABS6T671_9RHOB|nr:right-handed parallel beta-helix repeat-containing protein [Maritimibacter dapengensis]MBV7380725.1 right-handed parallel beta-helix repeat-containing protein [Maritimibacter dapengensis]